MKDNFIVWVQERLASNGFSPGTIDGIWGRNTMNALKAFQRSYNIKATGQTDAETVAMLRRVYVADDATTPQEAPVQDLYGLYPWMATALSKKGLLEGRDNAELRKFLKSDGKTLGDPAKLPWCGDFVETCIALTMASEPLPVNPYLARNWMKFGRECEPAFGAVLVFWRTSKTKSTNGHVAFCVGEDDKHFYCLGGNQSNSVSIAKLDKARLLGARQPLTLNSTLSHKVRMTDDGPVSTNEA